MGRRREPIRHGTPGGNRAHFRHGVPMCEPCRQADRDRRGVKPLQPAQCGTDSGYCRHLKRGEVTCPACRRAHAEKMADYYKRVGRPPARKRGPA